MNQFKFCFTGGGTGGHIYPAIAIYTILKNSNMIDKAIYIGNQDKPEGIIVPQYDIPFKHIKSTPFAGKKGISKFLFFFSLLRGMLSSLFFLLSFRPHFIIATGGYVSAPIVFTAFLLKICLKHKIIIHEQNIIPGIFNKFASIFADTVFVSFTDSAFFLWSNRCLLTGYPFREEYYNTDQKNIDKIKEDLSIPQGKPVILSYGGSTGARTLNRAIPELLNSLEKKEELFFVHITGKGQSKYKAFQDTRKLLSRRYKDIFNPKTNEFISGGKVFGKLLEYSENLFQYQFVADIIITRSGAGAITELALLGKTVIFVPKMGLSSDHQVLNAFTLAEQKACMITYEEQNKQNKIYLPTNKLLDKINLLLNHKSLRDEMATNIQQFAQENFRENVVKSILALKNDPDSLEFIDQVIMPAFAKHQINFDSLITHLSQIDLNQETYLYEYYKIKLNHYLTSSQWQIQNKAIKLSGALKNIETIDHFITKFPQLNGFQKRNLFIAIFKNLHSFPHILNIILQGLNDSYYEVRREAIKLIPCKPDIFDSPELKDRLIFLLHKKNETFEVKCEIIKTLPKIFPPEEFIKLTSRFRKHKNPKIRELLLRTINEANDNGYFKNKQEILKFIKQTYITTTHFKPNFTLRNNYLKTYQAIEARKYD